ncbi:hypothetical protein [Nocardia jejuensis]|uniref:hypothetical protein n=1 Tax=Nocardia jejuensis TaxID=328049 RepID=UPI00082AEA62|nr:hypothetical protein [Nocardia jejuensis]
MSSDEFVAVMQDSTRLLQNGRAGEALALLSAYDDALLTQPEPRDYGWIVFYRFRAAFLSGDFAQALRLAENGPARFEADVPAENAGHMFSMAIEAATESNRADSAVRMANRCLELRRAQGQQGETLMAAMTAGTLLGRIGRFDLARPFTRILIEESAASPAFDRFRAFGYRQLCEAVSDRPDPELLDTLLAGREWLRASDDDDARVALAFIESSPALRERAERIDTPGVRFAAGADPKAVAAPAHPPSEQCASGERADELLAAGQAAQAVAAYEALIEQTGRTGRPDLFVLGKSVLGLLHALLFAGRTRDAHAVWTGEGGLPGLGILAIEQGQLSLHDLIGYRLFEAYMHGMSTGDRESAVAAVDKIMGSCLDYAFQHEPQVAAAMVNNWRRHLTEVFDDAPPPHVFAGVQAAEQRLGHPVPSGPLYWSRPSRWVIDWL